MGEFNATATTKSLRPALQMHQRLIAAFIILTHCSWVAAVPVTKISGAQLLAGYLGVPEEAAVEPARIDEDSSELPAQDEAQEELETRLNMGTEVNAQEHTKKWETILGATRAPVRKAEWVKVKHVPAPTTRTPSRIPFRYGGKWETILDTTKRTRPPTRYPTNSDGWATLPLLGPSEAPPSKTRKVRPSKNDWGRRRTPRRPKRRKKDKKSGKKRGGKKRGNKKQRKSKRRRSKRKRKGEEAALQTSTHVAAGSSESNEASTQISEAAPVEDESALQTNARTAATWGSRRRRRSKNRHRR